MVPPGGDGQPEPDVEPGYALPSPRTSPDVLGPVRPTEAPNPSVVAGDSPGGSPALAVAAGASAGSSTVRATTRWSSTTRSRDRDLPRQTMQVLQKVFNERPGDRRRTATWPPADPDPLSPAADTDVRERLDRESEPAAPSGTESDRRRAVGPPPPSPALQSQIEQELQASLVDSRLYVERNQQALPIFSPLMVIPGAAN